MKFLNEKNLLKLISYGPLIFIPFVVIVISLLLLHVRELEYKKSLKDIETSYTETQKSKIVSKVDMAIRLIEYKKSITETMLKEKVKNRVDIAYSVAKNLYIQNKHTKKELQKEIIDSLRPLIWNKGESFIFILDFEGVFYLAPEYLRHLEGKSVLNFQDATKRYVIQEEIKLAKNKGEGYLWDTFTRPNYDKNRQFKQLAYIKKFGDFDWYMGSAEYLDTTNKELENSALEILKNIFINESDYFFALDDNGNNIMSGQNLIKYDTNILSLKDIDGKEIAKELIKSANSDTPYFVPYKIRNPQTNKVDQKYSYVRKVPNSSLIVGSGFYQHELNEKIEIKQLELKELYSKAYNQILFLSFIIMIISLVVSYYISLKLKERIMEYSKALKEKNILLKELYHRVKNNLQIISSILSLQSRRIEDKKTKLIFDETNQRIKAMAMLHEKLCQSNDLEAVDMQVYVLELIENLKRSFQTNELSFEIVCENFKLDLERAVPMGLIINELVTNSVKYAFDEKNKNKTISVKMYMMSEDKFILEIYDNGKGTDLKAVNEGFGFKLIEALASFQLKGSIECFNKNGLHHKIIFSRESCCHECSYC